MDNQEKLNQCIKQYETLCALCDAQFGKVAAKYPQQIACRPGCGDCCQMESVLPLEAYYIERYIKEQTNSQFNQDHQPGKCVFLKSGYCLIYPARPLICRSHGMLLRLEDNSIVSSCSNNFVHEEPGIEPEMIFDNQWASEQLVKLNMAYNMILNQDCTSHKRIPLIRLTGSPLNGRKYI